MTFFKTIFAAATLAAMASTAQAGFTCEAHSYGNGLSATRGSHSKQVEIIKSWIPEQFVVDEESLRFNGWGPIDVRSYTDQKIRAFIKLEDDNGKKHDVTYEIILKNSIKNDGIRALVTMRERRFKPLGPVVFNCVKA